MLFPALIIGASTLLAGMVSPYHNAKKPWKEAVTVSVDKMQMLAGQILFPTFLYYADARCGNNGFDLHVSKIRAEEVQQTICTCSRGLRAFTYGHCRETLRQQSALAACEA